ncbi:hypothetical protein OQJ13_10400 [Legionella sp. PATHC035]|uniref:hypothetical protein n=1 Tax=Legionella sp. PATHC035 TaxID=2992040 RepID=UPI0022433BB4|nr:hypothetical protein [Legionella sp. PATHC035]MCW8409384.1 hypothetical protein [Legionella sp. PATHC035]
MFFSQPKINRITLHLESTLNETCRKKWAYCLGKATSAALIPKPTHLKEMVDPNKIFNTWTFFRGKEHFSWDLIALTDADEVPALRAINAMMQYEFYKDLYQGVQEINKKLSQSQPDYQSIIDDAKKIKRRITVVTSVRSAHETIKIEADSWKQGNLFFDFCKGLVGIVHAPLMLLVGTLCAIPYYLSHSEYCGGPEFFLDTAAYFCESVRQVLFSVLFPLAMLYSAYTTNSFNPFTQGEISRSLDGIISLAQAELDKEVEQMVHKASVD